MPEESAIDSAPPPSIDEIATELFHKQRRLHPGHVLGKNRCREIVQQVLFAAKKGDR